MERSPHPDAGAPIDPATGKTGFEEDDDGEGEGKGKGKAEKSGRKGKKGANSVSAGEAISGFSKELRGYGTPSWLSHLFSKPSLTSSEQ